MSLIRDGRKLCVAVIGCGRQGRIHAINLVQSVPRSHLIAIVDPSPEASPWIQEQFGYSVKVFATAEALFRYHQCSVVQDQSEDRLDAVVIATSTKTHTQLATLAIDHGVHVLLEKPISTSQAEDEVVLRAAKARLELKVVVALSRRFDESYRAAFHRLASGAMGEAFLVKSSTIELLDESERFKQYAKDSGGIFIDCGIHDIDIALWFLGLSKAGCNFASVEPSSARPVRCFATGYNAIHKHLAEHGDADTALGTVELSDGRSFTIQLGRTARHGHECSMQVFGTKGSQIVNQVPNLDRTQILDEHGVRHEATPTYFQRFEQAFVTELREFVDACLDGKDMLVSLEDAVVAARIAHGLTESMRTGQIVLFDDDVMPRVQAIANVNGGSRH